MLKNLNHDKGEKFKRDSEITCQRILDYLNLFLEIGISFRIGIVYELNQVNLGFPECLRKCSEVFIMPSNNENM